ncbi:MAG: clan AA aspartic protease [Gemmatimonadota bacterium]|nr:clan AA aspartic protease [Gemmatimonadota bacterium]
MITGQVTVDREAVIQLEVFGSEQKREIVDFVIDTGFNGYLILPVDLVERLNLRSAGKRRATLGDGNTVLLDVCIASVLWNKERRDVLALRADGGPLIGMSLLHGNRVKLVIVDGGEVTIEPIR